MRTESAADSVNLYSQGAIVTPLDSLQVLAPTIFVLRSLVVILPRSKVMKAITSYQQVEAYRSWKSVISQFYSWRFDLSYTKHSMLRCDVDLFRSTYPHILATAAGNFDLFLAKSI